ncbi:putative electron transport complex protein RnfD [Selenomonas ruminantium subsp. lactilytica TAM6421]|uniref:Ion-translocating oxidoreductase complex subunit D n=1 Tax=Selenomonas ruminantium subsp. lactilytica (strain NBRC 103574 / TAM6421) TaxID=927704 RepID=I0GMV2_SELRL|nr:RnfABCDGE type electron transport complex subunit D [Selenomonas ruminantium]BAL82089.1 putative electron transport complex protein RnfD [Selenomonas ruminantium subsp. lactilytica TAM6421]
MSEEVMKKEPELFTVSVSPHIRDDETISHIMWQVNAALLPAALFAIWWFGIPALINMLVGVVFAVLGEYIWQKGMHQPITAFDGSACITGLLLAMSMSPLLPPYMVAIGSLLAIIVAKQSMGGLGFNIFNPAHIGRAALMVSWPVAMTTWTKMTDCSGGVDAMTSATPLNILKMQGYDALVATFGSQSDLYWNLFIGTRNGSLGETSTLLLLLGGLYLIWKGYVNWQVPVTMIATVAVLTWIFGPAGLFTGDPLFHMMAGGLMLGAFFMATDMVTIPMTIKGQLIFAVGAGALTVLIRLVGGYPEGVCYSLLLMNAVTPLIDRFCKPRIFGAGGAK